MSAKIFSPCPSQTFQIQSPGTELVLEDFTPWQDAIEGDDYGKQKLASYSQKQQKN